ncbi:hypothetical protein UVI_02026830 [Ustilaginoidea virens]|uniref:Cyanovirin-N domain-containing protein n=1 Tax=Ustilaginoidea virens TaxID=1159556 RepID=A0A1B5L3B5_USTVR|nr:hypothetical protein UVI_02026830 [Ustilaginoidea virens]
MMLGLLVSLLPATAGMVLGRDAPVPPGACCFALLDVSSGQAVQQRPGGGYLTLGAGDPDGWYCIDLADSKHVLRDAFDNACFVNSDQQLQCLDPTPGFDAWSLQHGGGDALLAVNGGTGFSACRSSAGRGVYARVKAGESGCQGIRLKARGLRGTCQDFRG